MTGLDHDHDVIVEIATIVTDDDLAIVAEGSLSFLGLGVFSLVVLWGGMLADGRKHLADGWWMAVMPGVALSITVLATNLFGDWLRVNSDPTTKR